MSELETKIKTISTKYAQLKKCDNVDQKLNLSNELISLCVGAEKSIQKVTQNQEKFKLAKQVGSIKAKVIDISQQCQKQKLRKRNSSDSSDGSRDYVVEVTNGQSLQINEEQMSKKIVRTILQQQLTAKDKKVDVEEFQRLAARMQQNLSVMEEIKQLIRQQGTNLENAEQNIVKALDETQEANKDLEEAASLQLRARLRKIRLGVSGVLGSIGYFFWGIPGALLALAGTLKIPGSRKQETKM